MAVLKEDRPLTPEEVCYDFRAYNQAAKELGPGATTRQIAKRGNEIIDENKRATKKHDYHDPWYCP